MNVTMSELSSLTERQYLDWIDNAIMEKSMPNSEILEIIARKEYIGR